MKAPSTPPKAGDKCPHGFYWYAEVESENPDHPVGSLGLLPDLKDGVSAPEKAP